MCTPTPVVPSLSAAPCTGAAVAAPCGAAAPGVRTGAAVADIAGAPRNASAWIATGITAAGFLTRLPNHPLYQKENDSPARTTSGTHMFGGDSWACSNL